MCGIIIVWDGGWFVVGFPRNERGREQGKDGYGRGTLCRLRECDGGVFERRGARRLDEARCLPGVFVTLGLLPR